MFNDSLFNICIYKILTLLNNDKRYRDHKAQRGKKILFKLYLRYMLAHVHKHTHTYKCLKSDNKHDKSNVEQQVKHIKKHHKKWKLLEIPFSHKNVMESS